MKIIKKIIPVVLSLLLAPSVLATDTQPIKINIEEQVAQFMAKEDIPALAIGIIQNGKVVFTSGLGVLDRKNSQPINTKTLFQIGSHAKPITSIITLALIDEGKLKLTDRVVDHLPGVFPKASLDQFKSLTIEHLMVHRSGLPTYPSNVTRIDGDAMQGGYNEQKLLAALNTIELMFSPGSKWRYSNFNYAVLGYVLSKVTNKSYDQLVKQYVADVYDVASLQVNLSDQQKNTLLATPYRKDNRQVATKPWDMGLLAPHGGVYASIDDFSRLMEQQLAAYAKFNQTGVASPLVSTQVIYDTQYSHMGQEYPGLNYGLGMFEATPELGMSVETVLYHGGDLDGFGSEYRFSPEYGVGVVMLTSSGGRKFIRFAMKIMDQLLIDAVSNQKSLALALD